MKTNQTIAGWLMLAAIITVNIQPSTGFAQGTAFTYQGRLNDGGSPANGSYDLQFALFDAATGGHQVGGTVTNLAAGVTNGLFITTIDFGRVFTGSALWLQIGVETNGSGGTFTRLNALQPLTPTPYAIYASSADAATTANGVSAGSVTGAGIASGQVVKSLNGLADGVTLSPGANVTITPSGNTLTIASTAAGGGGGSNSWSLTGNSGTSPANGNFLGTLDNQPLELHVNGLRVLRLEPGTSGLPNVIGGAANNAVAGGVHGAAIGGGAGNGAGGQYSTVGGGIYNYAGGPGSFVGGGGYDGYSSYGNTANGNASTVGGGIDNQAMNYYATVGGGSQNQATGVFATVGGGNYNTAGGGDDSTVGGGANNNADGDSSTVGGGNGNTAYDDYSTVGGGNGNTAGGSYSTVGGGAGNGAGGNYSTVPGGSGNYAGGTYSFAAGQQASANNQGAFVWADSQNGTFASTANNQFAVRAAGGAVFVTSGAGMTLDGQPVLTPNVYTSLSFGSATRQMLNLYGSTYGIGVQAGTLFFRSDATYASSGDFSWFRGGTFNNGQNQPGSGGAEMMRLDHLGNLNVSNNVVAHSLILASDRNLKSNFMPVNTQEVLAKVAALPITAWDFKSEAGVQHIGPMAQDFYAAFNVGSDDKHIAVVDESGVALAAIQGLNQKLQDTVKQKDSEIQALEQRLAALEKLVNPSR